MLRLLFCTAAILPIAIIPWMTSEAETLDPVMGEASYTELVTDPNLDALNDCRVGELPVFFHDALITTHSAEAINAGMKSAEACGDVTVTVIPVLPAYADSQDLNQSDRRTTELVAYVDAAAKTVNASMDIEIVDRPVEDDISTLYINGRAAILRIDPNADAG
ncbi:hypothetical protein ACFFUB_06630 [Algimonas porphyrae]|uniref:Uncharacterized protein n=1 Tax=Algimonas porphyrae TaxID=1128113 RepID=A0ABQ5V257_9PROT|nr:hypothetical protein [Algimonas porphyrae]GLQ21162.1 hypothetical protein GCM10007854_21170 [Algimonas porphyrae]